MNEETREALLDAGVTKEEIKGLQESDIKIIEKWFQDRNDYITIYKDSEELGADHSDSDLYEEDDTDYTFGEFLLHVPDAKFVELITGRIIGFND